jgi:hypothetical protein
MNRASGCYSGDRHRCRESACHGGPHVIPVVIKFLDPSIHALLIKLVVIVKTLEKELLRRVDYFLFS